MKLTWIFIVAVILLTGVSIGVFWVKTSNREKVLVNTATAQTSVCQSFYTKMRNILIDKHVVSKEYAENFDKIQKDVMEGRYSDGQKLMMWIQEDNPDFDPSLYKDLMTAIEAERNGFFMEQKKLIDIKREHDNLRMLFPTSLVVGNRDELKIVVLQDETTKNDFNTGNYSGGLE